MDESQYAIEVSELQFELQNLFDSFVYVDDQAKLSEVNSILSEIGKIDWDTEGFSSPDNQRDLSVKFHWGHNHRFNETLHVDGRMGDRHVNLMAQFMARYKLVSDHFKGKDIVDVGCWTGGTTLLLKAMGAECVLALEEVQKYARAANRLINTVYEQRNITSEGTNIYDLESDKKYDIAYFPGVIYHLSDPVLALRRLFNVLKDGGEIFVETMGMEGEEPICRFEGNRKHHNAEGETRENLNRGGWNWFVPTPTCLSLWMREAGFDDIDCFYSYASNRVFGYGRRKQFSEITRAGFSRREIQ